MFQMFYFRVCFIIASIVLPQNGIHPMMPPGKQMDSPGYYNYSSQDQGIVMHVQGLQNGPALSPSGNPHKRLKRTTMSSISSADDEVESVGDENESMSSYYGKSPNLSGNSSAGWQGDGMDPGMFINEFNFKLMYFHTVGQS
jgi:hypothetical protein